MVCSPAEFLLADARIQRVVLGLVLVAFGWFWLVLVGSGWFWLVLVGFGWLLSFFLDSGWFWVWF